VANRSPLIRNPAKQKQGAANEAFEAAKRAADEAFKAAKRTTERAGDDDASSDGTPVSGESEPTNKEPCQAKARPVPQSKREDDDEFVLAQKELKEQRIKRAKKNWSAPYAKSDKQLPTDFDPRPKPLPD
jgi:hypothetical protein